MTYESTTQKKHTPHTTGGTCEIHVLLTNLRSAGFFPDGFPQIAVPTSMLLNMKDFLLVGEHSRQSIDDRCKQVRALLAGYRAMTAGLKRGCSDMCSALNTIKAAEQLQSRNSSTGNGPAAKMAAKKAKARKLPSYANTSDPSIIKIHKMLCKDHEIPKATSWESLKSNKDGNSPFILRCRGAEAGRLQQTHNICQSFNSGPCSSFESDIFCPDPSSLVWNGK